MHLTREKSCLLCRQQAYHFEENTSEIVVASKPELVK